MSDVFENKGGEKLYEIRKWRTRIRRRFIIGPAQIFQRDICTSKLEPNHCECSLSQGIVVCFFLGGRGCVVNLSCYHQFEEVMESMKRVVLQLRCGHHVRACAMVSQIFGPSEEREDATQAIEPFLLAREPVVVQW